MNIKNNIGKAFLDLLYKHFPPTHPFQKYLIKAKFKISYSYMRNLNSIISAHNRSILSPLKTNSGCNCRDKTNCPLQNQCLKPNTVYQVYVSNNMDNEKRFYLGVSEIPLSEISEIP